VVIPQHIVELDVRLRMVSAVKTVPFGEGDKRDQSLKETFNTPI
jgi:hypothetical protein